ncbi:unnamed protein product [Owenia fusiformis]|uniref:Uncharacterized protein n=1 Tax=Owenia fusiformis TaxID=6347 RepID=A0A8J1TUM2_OWEFU|nr:unnamed protein product [Owenia fusiformis]
MERSSVCDPSVEKSAQMRVEDTARENDQVDESRVNVGEEKPAQLKDCETTVRIGGMRVQLEAGILWPNFWPKLHMVGLEDSTTWAEWLEEASHFKVRPDDIFINSYPKSGHHWTYEIISRLTAGSGGRNTTTNKMDAFFEWRRISVFDNLPSPRLLLTHLPFHLMPKEAFKKPCKHIYLVRNPKDTAVSFYYHTKGLRALDYDGSFSDFYESFIKGEVEYNSWFDHVSSWWKSTKNHPNVLWVHYEDLNKKFIPTLKKMASFLGYQANDNLLQQIAEKSSFKNMKEHSEKHDLKAMWKTKDGTMFRKGQVGNWKEYFTVAQNEKFDKVYEDKMADCQDLRVQFS